MADHSRGRGRSRASFWAQSNALLRKNLTFQKRNMCSNISLVLIPGLLCLILLGIQIALNKAKASSGGDKCDGSHTGTDSSGLGPCPFPNPPEWPPLLYIPNAAFRAVRSNSILPFTDLPDASCRNSKNNVTCPLTVLVTGDNQSFGQILAGNMFPNDSFPLNSSDVMDYLVNNVMGTYDLPSAPNFYDPAFDDPLFRVQRQCSPNSTISIPPYGTTSSESNLGRRAVVGPSSASSPIPQEVRCVEALQLWRKSSSEINNELYKGYPRGNPERKVNEILAAYDFSNSDDNKFDVTVWYNSSLTDGYDQSSTLRVGRSLNLASNAYLQFLEGSSTKMLFEFVKEFPKPLSARTSMLDIPSVIGPLFYTWIVLLLFPVVLRYLVYEKQQNLRIMMKMHGLGDAPYWMISYAYFLTVSSIYMLFFIAVGSIIGLKFFTINDYSIQFVFYFIYLNLQIAVAFLVASMFSNVKACTVISYILVFGTGLLADNLFQSIIEDESVSKRVIILIQLYPGFSLYRGLYEFAQYPIQYKKVGMRWGDLSDGSNGMREVLIIMVIEWFVVLLVAYCIDQLVSSGKSPFVFLQRFRKKKLPSLRRPSMQGQGSSSIQMEKPDVCHEIEMVERLVVERDTSHAIVCDNLQKVYPGRDGNPDTFAVKGCSLALPRGECFGMLGPNGAGKTSFISMMIGLTKPTSGTGYVHGMDIRTQMNKIYSSMGFCPQHDLLWETLTGREHLLFYGRLKNLKGSALMQVVEESLKSVNLFHGGVPDKQAGKYSGGMKRKLSVAISLIGDPKVVYMDEPSTGLDPASRNHLWNVIKSAKQDRAIILTTHSMEEAEVLCDRLGIFVDGRMQCIGNPKELKARYGGSYIFTMTTSWDHEEEVERMVRNLSPNALKTYRLSGTQKFELPKNEVRIADVFHTVECAKRRFAVFAWGVVDTTLEDVFIKVATTAGSPSATLS
ncbi:ABC transporter A family member 10-like [Pyrus communis]|uniref:ABC transporter A family member 10-like n=1 Tax=Pyrus communis TaxID=23211 RepID=UPI0035C17DD8